MDLSYCHTEKDFRRDYEDDVTFNKSPHHDVRTFLMNSDYDDFKVLKINMVVLSYIFAILIFASIGVECFNLRLALIKQKLIKHQTLT